MKVKKLIFFFVMLLIIGGVTFFEDNIGYALSLYFNDRTATIITNAVYDGIYYAVLISFGILTMKFASENYSFKHIGYIIGGLLFAASIIVMLFMAAGSRKDIFFAILAFIPSMQIMSIVNDFVLNHILYWKFVEKSGALEVMGAIILVITAVSVYILHLDIYIMLYYAFIYFYGSYTKRGDISHRIKFVFRIFSVLSLIYIFSGKIIFTIKNMTISDMGYGTYIIVSLYVLWLIVIGFCETIGKSSLWQYFNKANIIYIRENKNDIKHIEYHSTVKNHIYSTSIMFFLICGIEMFIRFMAMPEFTVDNVLNVMTYFVSGTFFYNLFMIYCVVNIIYAAFGRNITFIIILFSFVVYLIANGIKLHFHNSVFKFVDIVLIREMILMAQSYIGTVGVVLIVVVLLFLLTLVIVNIKRILKFLKPKLRIGYAAAILSLTFIFILSCKSIFFISAENNADLDQTSKYMNEGVFLYNYDNLIESKKLLFPEKPEDYSKETMDNINKKAEEYKQEISDTKPDVIVLLIESYFDINQAEEFTINQDALPVYRKYGKGNIVSPYFGGESAAIEFEMMTGLSNYYMLEGVIPYTIYFDENEKFPSIVGEFKDNGYETNVVQPVQPSFYNSSNAYKSMGVDNFYSKDILDKEAPKDTDYIPDEFIGNKIIDIASDNSKPKFILGVTMEEHSPYADKYNDDDLSVEVELNSDKLTEADAAEIAQYTQSIINGGKMIQNVIDYMDSTDRPTLLYVFGDHLPPLSPLKETDIVNNKLTKYQTPLILYSNYKDISLGNSTNRITPNQLAPQILRDAEIKHSPYFDYIYSLREKYPVIHKEFLSNADKDELRDYYLVQYDLIFGNKYLIE